MEIPHTITFSHTLPFIVGSGRYKAVGELPAHGHNATANSTGDHTHTVVGRDGGATKYTDNASYYKRTDTSSTYNTGSSGSHTHSVTVDKSGEGKSHNTMQPYLSCYMWRRTV